MGRWIVRPTLQSLDEVTEAVYRFAKFHMVHAPAIIYRGTRKLLDERLLPREWVMAVNGAKEGDEIGPGAAPSPSGPDEPATEPEPMYRPDRASPARR